MSTKIYNIGLNNDNTEIITTYMDRSPDRIQTIKHLNEVIKCCDNCIGNRTLEDLNTRKKQITHYCHGCDQYQYVKYIITNTTNHSGGE